MKLTAALSAAAAIQAASAHTIFTQLNKNGIGNGVRVFSYDGPITNVQSNDIACNGPSNGGGQPAQSTNTVLNVAAGSTVQLEWRHTLSSGADDVIDPSHKGPTMVYLKKVSDATKDTGIGGGWFKIQEDGLSGGKWGVERLIAAQGVHTATIPKCIANGQYLLRGELIALHSAGSQNGAQFYTECAQINVTGGTGAKTPATISLPGEYKATDPGILINIYQTLSSYTIPGPRPLTC